MLLAARSPLPSTTSVPTRHPMTEAHPTLPPPATTSPTESSPYASSAPLSPSSLFSWVSSSSSGPAPAFPAAVLLLGVVATTMVRSPIRIQTRPRWKRILTKTTTGQPPA